MPEGCEFTTTTLPSYLLERGGDSAHASGHAVASERRARSSAGELAPPSPPCRIYVETPPECEPYTTMDDDPADQHSVYHWIARSVSIYPWRVASAAAATSALALSLALPALISSLYSHGADIARRAAVVAAKQAAAAGAVRWA